MSHMPDANEVPLSQASLCGSRQDRCRQRGCCGGEVHPTGTHRLDMWGTPDPRCLRAVVIPCDPSLFWNRHSALHVAPCSGVFPYSKAGLYPHPSPPLGENPKLRPQVSRDRTQAKPCGTNWLNSRGSGVCPRPERGQPGPLEVGH